MKFLLDENISPHQTIELRKDGYDVLSVVEAGFSGAADEVIRQVAIDTGRVLITLDSDFSNMLRLPPLGTPGILRIRVHPAIESTIYKQLRFALSRLGDTDITNCLAVCQDDKVRIRRMP